MDYGSELICAKDLNDVNHQGSSGVEGYITKAQGGLCDHKTSMVEAVVVWKIDYFIANMMFS